MVQQVRVILNSKVLFEGNEVTEYIGNHSKKFQVVTTPRINDEYIKEILSPGLVHTRLLELGKCHTPKRPVKLNSGQIPGLRKHHANFVLDACSAQSDYLVTRHPEWLDLNDTLKDKGYQLKIVTPEQFLNAIE